MSNVVLVAGGTGNLGERIVKHLIKNGATVKIVVRNSSKAEKLSQLTELGAEVLLIDMDNQASLEAACKGVSCVVSALSGLEEVIIGVQKKLFDAAVNTGVPRFIASDYSLDFTRLPAGRNRNLDFRREFHKYIENKNTISITSIFNGAFADMLTDQMPLILFKKKKILHWGSALQLMDFTTIENTAEFTAKVATDNNICPRYLRIAGDRINAREISEVASEVFNSKFGIIRAGGLGLLSFIIKIAKLVAPGKTELYPAWQGMQYMRDMCDGRAIYQQLDNNRYPEIKWMKVKDVLIEYKNGNGIDLDNS